MDELSIERLKERLVELHEEETYKINKIISKYRRNTPVHKMEESDIKEIKGIMKWYKHMRESIDSFINIKTEEDKNDKKMIEDYIGQYIGSDNIFGYQSTDLVNKYFSDLTDGKFRGFGNASVSCLNDYPYGWNVYKVDSRTSFRKGDVFVNTNGYGFNGIITAPYGRDKVLIVAQNFNGQNGIYYNKKDEPVGIHEYPISEIHYIIRPSSIDIKRNFKIYEDSDTLSNFDDHKKTNENTVTLDLDKYNEIIAKANKYDELEANGEVGTDLDIHIEMTMRSVEDMLDGDKLIHNIHEKRKR